LIFKDKNVQDGKQIRNLEKITRFNPINLFGTQAISKEELFGLTSQIRRSAASILTNIIEGPARQHVKEFRQFLFIANDLWQKHNIIYFWLKV